MYNAKTVIYKAYFIVTTNENCIQNAVRKTQSDVSHIIIINLSIPA